MHTLFVKIYRFRASLLLGAAALLSPNLAFAVPVENPLGNITICGLILKVLNALLMIGAPISVLLIVYVGFQFVMAQGNQAAITKAIENLKYTLLGILIFFGSTLIAQVIAGTLTQLGVVGLGSCQM